MVLHTTPTSRLVSRQRTALADLTCDPGVVEESLVTEGLAVGSIAALCSRHSICMRLDTSKIS
jgi:hypothetical protein